MRLAGHRRVARERSQTIRQGLMRTVVARRECGPRGSRGAGWGRSATSPAAVQFGVRGVLVLITGQLWAVDGGDEV